MATAWPTGSVPWLPRGVTAAIDLYGTETVQAARALACL